MLKLLYKRWVFTVNNYFDILRRYFQKYYLELPVFEYKKFGLIIVKFAFG